MLNISLHQTLFVKDRDLEDSLQASDQASEEAARAFYSRVVYLEIHKPLTEDDAEIIGRFYKRSQTSEFCSRKLMAGTKYQQASPIVKLRSLECYNVSTWDLAKAIV